MADFRDIYRTPLLSAKALGKKVITAKIEAAYPETVQGTDGSSKDRLIIELGEGEYRIALNKSNAVELAHIFGSDYDEWIGRTVIVKVGKRDYLGKPTDSLFVTAKTK
jgi:hypothetical protein